VLSAEASICGTHTLKGSYLWGQGGFLVLDDGNLQRLASSGKEFFDGRGNVQSMFTVSVDGKVIISSNC